MTPSGFQLLVKNFTRLDSAEHEFVQSLLARHPYSQLLHVLVARSSKDHGRPDQASRLNRAAVYATDRSVVKWAMTEPARTRVEVPAPTTEIKQKPASPVKEVVAEATTVTDKAPVKVSTPVKQATAAPAKEVAPAKEAATVKAKLIERSALEGDALRADLATELKRLQQWKREFQVSYENFKTGNPTIKAIKVEAGEEQDPAIIEEIKATRKKLKIPSPKVAEQGEIIDKFIKGAPSIPKPTASTPTADLSLDSASYGDHVVSETLVDILVKQGKKVKAIEMLKKLIWKFPQKKAYFAAQIEALKD